MSAADVDRWYSLVKGGQVILFLDFDGVLHPDAVFLTRRGPQLRADGELFMWSYLLEQELKAFPDVRIVLSTSWVRNLGFSRTLKRLPSALQRRVVGSTWHSSMSKKWADEVGWDQSSRYNQINRYVARSVQSHWLAIDDDVQGWPDTDRTRLIRTDPGLGLSGLGALPELRRKLADLSKQ